MMNDLCITVAAVLYNPILGVYVCIYTLKCMCVCVCMKVCDHVFSRFLYFCKKTVQEFEPISQN